MSGGHDEVSVEHLLVALIEAENSDVQVILNHFGADGELLLANVRRQLGVHRRSNAGRPVFSRLLLEWIQDTWIFTSLETQATEIRSGALLTRLVEAQERYSSLEMSELRRVRHEQLARELDSICQASVEAPRAAAQPEGERRPVSPATHAGGEGPLDKFTLDLTAKARAGHIDPVLGREKEIRQVVDVLSRRRKNNPMIVGEPGVGKTALVEGLALRIVEESVPDALRGARVLSLDLGALQAGAGVRGEFENRLRGVIEAIKASEVPIVLFIDEAHTLIGAGGPQGGGDAANLLKPALARGELRTIAATTYAEFKKYFEKDAALERRFQPIRVDEPSLAQAELMIRGLARRFKEAHGVTIHDSAVRAAVTLSARYITGRQLPDKAVDLLDTGAAYVKVIRRAPPAALEDTRAKLRGVEEQLSSYKDDRRAGASVDARLVEAAEALRAELEERALHLEKAMNEQRAIVARLDEARIAMGDLAEATPDVAAVFAEIGAIPHAERLVHADVDEAVIAAIVSEWTGVPVGKMVKDDLRAVLELEERLTTRVRGQTPALAVLGRELRAARSGLKAPTAPLGVFLLVGPSGVGKTETALALADLMFGGERFMTTINMSEFQEKHSVSRLIGSPPGYVGFGEGGVLTEAVRHRPYSVVLLDEIEKADPEVMNLFYQVFDKGTLSDGEGRIVDFTNTVIVMTSNLATDLITQAAAPDEELPSHDTLVEIVKPILSRHLKPALLARMTVVPYVPIRRDALTEIAKMKIGAALARAATAHQLAVELDDAVVEAVAERCREVESGARNIDHILRQTLLPKLSTAVLDALVEERKLARLRVELDSNREIVCTVTD